MEIDTKSQDAAWEEYDRLTLDEDVFARGVVIEAELVVMRYPEDERLRYLAETMRQYIKARDKRSTFIRETLTPINAAMTTALLETAHVG